MDQTHTHTHTGASLIFGLLHTWGGFKMAAINTHFTLTGSLFT